MLKGRKLLDVSDIEGAKKKQNLFVRGAYGRSERPPEIASSI